MLETLFYQRSSVRDFKDKPIPKDVIQRILDAGRLSPSGNNAQPWYFGVINDSNQIKKIADCAYQQKFIESAPLVIVLCTVCDMIASDQNLFKAQYPSFSDAALAMDEALFSALYAKEHQTKIPGTHMSLSALEAGVYSTWISYFDAEAVGRVLSLPDTLQATEILVFGYPKTLISPREKKTLEEVVFYNQF